MDTIDTFLTAMFAPYPSTPRLLEAKGELRTMMEDAYADAIAQGRTHNEAVGQVITDFGNLEELAPILGIETEIRPVATASDDLNASGADKYGRPMVTLADAQALAEARRTTGALLGRGVAILTVAPIPLMLSSSLNREATGLLPVSKEVAPIIALPLTLVLVAIGVAILIQRSRAFVSLKHLTDGEFVRNPATAAWAARLRADNEGPRSRALAIAVGLWICSAIPLITLSQLLETDRSDMSPLGMALTLLLVATGLRIFLPTTWASSTYSTLTEEGRPGPGQPQRMETDPLIGLIASIYWPSTVAIYLTWSFITDGWDRTWMIWPIAGVLFGVLCAVIAAWRRLH